MSKGFERLSAFASLAALCMAWPAPAMELRNDEMRIVFGEADDGFAIRRIEPLRTPGVGFVSTDGTKADLFDLAFRRPSDGQWPFHVTNRSQARSKRAEKTKDGARFVFEGLTLHGDRGAVDVVCEVKMTRRTSEWTICATNRSAKYALLRTDYPLLRGVVPDGAGDVLMAYKNRGGLLIPKCDMNRPAPGAGRRHGYPGCHMPLAAFHVGGAGLSIAAHDGESRNKTLCLMPGMDAWFETPAENAGVAEKAENGAKYAVEVACYRGDWWKAAHLYRNWATRQKWCAKGKIAFRGDYPMQAARAHIWVIGGGRPSGNWNSASNILERMDMLWPDVGKCMEWSGLSTKCKNQFDPESFYTYPCEEVANVAKFGRDRGIMIMPYVNGRIWDTNLVSFAYARHDACMRADGSIPVEDYGGVKFAVMCPTRPTWHEIMRRRARDVLDADGADAVYLDQVSCSRPPEGTCHNPAHGHTLGGGSWWADGYRKMLEGIREDYAARGAAITSEQMGEMWIDLVDHYLDATPRNQYDVPLFAAVYSGYALSHGARIPTDGTDDRTYFRENCRTVLCGEAMGWVHVGTVLHDRYRPQAEVLHRIAQARASAEDFLVFGTLEGEMRAESPDEDVIGTWWRNAQGSAAALAIANAADTERTVRVRLPRGTAAFRPRALKGHSPCRASAENGVLSVTIPPRTMALLETGTPSPPLAALDELMPAPRIVEKRPGTMGVDGISNVKFVGGTVPGAPAAVAAEAYVLEVSPKGATVTAPGRLGAIHAKTTLAQLAKLGGGAVPCCRITDWPALRWRGFMLDTGRNYLGVASLKDLIDTMSAYKLNLFHWHMTEYYAWRLASRKYPQIAKRGFYDPHDSRHRGKCYSQEEFREIVDYAYARGVTVMPEFDVPGHAEAFRRAFGFKTMKDEGVKDTVCDLIDELCSLAPADKMPFVHLGGDEVWGEKEKIDESSMTAWAKTVARNGRTLVTWNPGQKFQPSGPRIAMLWGGAGSVSQPSFDARGWYIEDYDPFELLNAAAYLAPFGGAGGDANRLGAVFCGWHDSAVGLPYDKTFREQPVFPACVLLGDLYWRGRAYEGKYARRVLPFAGNPLLNVAIDLERRTVAQRDKVLSGLRHPFHFVRQTQMRWRMTDSSGKLVAKDIAQGSVFPYYGPNADCNLYHSPTGTVIVETWIKSPDARTVGAWIGFTAYDRNHGRMRSQGTPKAGCWNKFGATIEVNGKHIPPPAWEQPSLSPGERLDAIADVLKIDEIPYTNDEWYMREPTPVRLEKGWNHVKMTLPMTRPVNTWQTHRWVGTFMPVAGTTDHPREVDDLEYSSDPR